MEKSYMFWSTGPENTYAEGTPVPRVTYRCKGSAVHKEGLRTRKHECKLITDHDNGCICICGITFNEKETANV